LTDNYGDRRFDLMLSSVESYTTFFATYADLAKRLQWGATIFDDRSYYVYATDATGEHVERKEEYHETGGLAFAQYPLSFYHRVSGAVGFLQRSISYPVFTGEGVAFVSMSDNIPFLSASFTGDTVVWQSYGPHAGHRYDFTTSYNHDLKGGGPLSLDLQLDARQYVPISRRNEVAFRLFAGYADGNRPDFFYFGGLDTMRGFDYRSLIGNRAAYLNTEWRFPLIDHLVLPWLHLTEIRGRVFVDVGAAWFDLPAYTLELGGQKIDVPAYRQDFTFMKDGRLQDGVAALGYGFTLNIFGLPAHWDFARRWDFKDTLDKGYRTYFWIGFRY
jgi:outer membrane protein assembly factor BamA